MSFYKLFFINVLLLLVQNELIPVHSDSETITLPSSCNLLEDGYHYIQPFDNDVMYDLTKDSDIMEERTEALPIYVYCNNGYTILNVNIDEHIKQYFSTYYDYLQSAAGPDLNDHTSWEQWYLPSRYAIGQNEETKSEFSFSWSVTDEDCTKCLSEDELEYGSNTATYMTPDIASCNWATKNICDFDATTLECYTCESGNLHTGLLPGKCGHVQLSADVVGNSDHADCTESGPSKMSYLPSLITAGKYCVCYKPKDEHVTTYDVEMTYYDSVKVERDEYVEKLSHENDKYTLNNILTNIQYLSSANFEEGTYRITESGTYILTEDIIFNPHSLSKEDIYEKNISPNSEGAWYPYADQSEDYPGAGEYDGWYWLGFFAAVTIEASNVVLDLNGHSISMHDHFYYQQRYFIVVQISNKPFGDSAGPTWTGSGQITGLTNIEIKNGILGLSSHIGMHAVECSNVHLSDLVIKDFETHGVVFNGFTNLQLDNVEIGPSVFSQLPITGNYNLARMSFAVLRDAANEIGDKEITFYNREAITYSELFNKLQIELDLVFKYIAYNDDSVTSNEYWEEAQTLFISDLGVSRAGTLYGAVFRSKGAEVFNFGTNNGDFSDGLILNNVHIHDLELSTQEVVSTGSGAPAREMLNGPIPFVDPTNEAFKNSKSVYVGNVWLDILIALHNLSENWWHLNRFLCSDDVCQHWAIDNSMKPRAISCGYDSLGHVSKGAMGMKIEYVNNVQITNMEIDNIHTIGDKATSICGEWTDASDGGPILQESWTNKGYGATFAYGTVMFYASGDIDNVKIHDVASYYGPSYGHYLMFGNKITVKNSEIYNIFGGLMNDEDYSEDHLPNRANRACGVEWSTLDVDVYEKYRLASDLVDDNDVTMENVKQYCMIGHTGCEKTNGETYSAVNDGQNEVDENSCSETILQFSDGNKIMIESTHSVKILTNKNEKISAYQQARMNQKMGMHKSYLVLSTLLLVAFAIFLGIIIVYVIKKIYNNRNKQNVGASNEHQPLLTNTI